MLLNILFLLVLIVLLLILWAILKRKIDSYEDDPSNLPLPKFPIPRPKSNFVEPPREPVTIVVERNDNGVPIRVNINPSNLILHPDKQAAWSSNFGKIEIRFSPNSSPFGGPSFTAPNGGITLSGRPQVRATMNAPLNYIVLFTTPDGYLLKQDATVTVTRDRRDQKG